MVGISVTAISLTLRKTSVPVAMLSGQKIIVAVATLSHRKQLLKEVKYG